MGFFGQAEWEYLNGHSGISHQDDDGRRDDENDHEDKDAKGLALFSCAQITLYPVTVEVVCLFEERFTNRPLQAMTSLT